VANERQKHMYKGFPGKMKTVCHMSGQIKQAGCPKAELLKDNMALNCQVS